MKWIHCDKELDEFFEHANSIHPSIKFIAQLELNFDKIVIGWSSSKIVSGGPAL
jgi:hypothetical protein